MTSAYRAGGIVGIVGGNSGTIKECFNTGSVTAGSAGGIAGGVFHLNAYDCYNSGMVQGSEYAGGMNGTAGNSNNFTNFFNMGEICGEGSLGSISGSFVTGSLTNCYCSKSIRTTNKAKDAPTISAEDFTSVESFAGFDFETIWLMGEKNPVLRNVGSKIYNHELIKHDAVAVTCETSGNNEYYVCDYCGTVFKSDKETVTTVSEETIPSPGHQLVKHEAKAPTCLLEGNKEFYVCSTCGITYRADQETETLPKYEIIPALGHSWSDEYSVDIPATCIEGGSESIHCEVCGSQNEETIRAIPANGHVWSTEYEADERASCTEDGSESIHCEVCGVSDESTIRVITRLGHKWSDWEVTKQPTCTAEGEKRRICGNDASHVEVDEIDSLGHDYVAAVTEPTCTEKGFTTHACSRCGDSYTDGETAALGHSFTLYASDGNATCTEDGTKTARCDRGCGAADTVTDEGSALGHEWDEGKVTTEPTCSSEGVRTFTCKHDATHTRTEAVAFDPEAHAWDEGVVSVAPTCTEGGTVTYTCRNDSSHKRSEDIAALGHEWDSGVVTVAATYDSEGVLTYTCARCSLTRTEAIPALERTSLSKAEIGSIAKQTYSGKAIKPSLTVKVSGKVLVKGADYTVAYEGNVNAGTARVTITGAGAYKDTKSATFEIAKAANTLKLSNATRSVKLAKVKKAKQTVEGAKVANKGQGTITYSVKKVAKAKYKKYVSINKKNGKITLKKGCPKGSFKVTVKAVAAGNDNYKTSAAKTAVVTIKVS